MFDYYECQAVTVAIHSQFYAQWLLLVVVEYFFNNSSHIFLLRIFFLCEAP